MVGFAPPKGRAPFRSPAASSWGGARGLPIGKWLIVLALPPVWDGIESARP